MKRVYLISAVSCLLILFFAAFKAPQHLTVGSVTSTYKYIQPLDMEKYDACLGVGKGQKSSQSSFGSGSNNNTDVRDSSYCNSVLLLGTNQKGTPLVEYATQGAKIVLIPSIVAGFVVAFLGVLGGLIRCFEAPILDSAVQLFAEVVGALPRMVVILVCALILPQDMRGLLPLAVLWAILASPTAMDEAGAVAGRLGGARFVEALRAHGFGSFRIYLYHIVALNLRPVVVRQGAEVMMQVVFLEVALSYLAVVESQPSFTHLDNLHSWADLLRMGYFSLIADKADTLHALVLGLALITLIVVTASSVSKAARAK
ncbi:MAG: hypothetical protein VX278_22695 [Myxococcota bacterium]|nr:hypothetical protein [Myxococcota bacterium]